MDSGRVSAPVRRLLKPAYLTIKRMLFRVWFAGLKRELPFYRKVLVVAPHPDDEVLGLSGTILRFLAFGADVHILFMTRGEASHDDLEKSVVSSNRTRISDRVLASMGIASGRVTRWALPDGGIPRRNAPGFDDAAVRLGAMLERVRPDVLFVTHQRETWPYDHVASFEIAEAALGKYSGSCHCYGYAVWLWYSLPLLKIRTIKRDATYVAPVIMEMKSKRRLIKEYLDPLAPNGKPWSGDLPKSMLQSLDFPYEILTRYH
ncbi:hypothetical protein CHL67_02545 [Prosthecochloris sp. GSB1]|nr:hypothetical protein CHL67_02545 [Prosthecochloris sp. GSB1]